MENMFSSFVTKYPSNPQILFQSILFSLQFPTTLPSLTSQLFKLVGLNPFCKFSTRLLMFSNSLGPLKQQDRATLLFRNLNLQPYNRKWFVAAIIFLHTNLNVRNGYGQWFQKYHFSEASLLSSGSSSLENLNFLLIYFAKISFWVYSKMILSY